VVGLCTSRKNQAELRAVRKAYKKRALQTHPDRQSGATEEQKKASEEEFRKVCAMPLILPGLDF
jgi:curved DNA-binding protein CbpA